MRTSDPRARRSTNPNPTWAGPRAWPWRLGACGSPVRGHRLHAPLPRGSSVLTADSPWARRPQRSVPGGPR
eukprot:10236949-Heterocapsa_arctica.AAC.1